MAGYRAINGLTGRPCGDVLPVYFRGKEVSSMTEKKTWSQPTLTEFGNVEDLTLAGNKVFGTGDAFTFQGQTTRLSG